jgi:ribonuclease P protein component
MLPKQERLTRWGEFREVLRRGRRYVAAGLVVYYRRGVGGARVGIRVPRRVGGAVVRNRVRRRLREAYRGLRAEALAGDYVLVARDECAAMGMLELKEALREVLKRVRDDSRE